MLYFNMVLSEIERIFYTVLAFISALTTAQGFAAFVLFLLIAPRILLFLTGQISKLFKKPRLLVRAYNGKINENSNRLIVLVSGIRSPKLLMRKVEIVLCEEVERADVLKLRFDNAFFSNANPIEISRQIDDLIASQHSKKAKSGTPYLHTTIVTHSLGALFVKKAILNASRGFGRGHPNSANLVSLADAKWRNTLDKIISLGGIHAGFNRFQTMRIHLITLLLEWMGIGNLVLACENGKPFVETLRQEWIDMLRSPHGYKAPISVQIMGDGDWAVPKNNLIDLEAQIGNEINPNHINIELGGTSHFSILDMAMIDDGELGLVCRRAQILLDAINQSPQELANIAIAQPKTEIKEQVEKRSKVERLVFVYDDKNQKDVWVETVNQACIRMFGNVDNIKVVRETPPLLSRFSFLLNLFGRRDRALQWFNAKCTELKSQYPNATLSIIAINNGTWICANGLQESPALKVETMFLVGAILPREFEWAKIVKDGRLGLLCNALSHEDLFCATIGGFYEWLSKNLPIFGRLKCFSLGDAGFAGFNWVGDTMGEIAYIDGTSNAFLESRSTIRFATAFAAFGGPIEEANILATQAYDAITHETDPEQIVPDAIITSDYIGNAAKAVKFLNKFSWGVGSALLIAICGAVIGLSIVIYQMVPVYSSVAIIIPLLLVVLVLDSL
jgi:hypothetical protein